MGSVIRYPLLKNLHNQGIPALHNIIISLSGWTMTRYFTRVQYFPLPKKHQKTVMPKKQALLKTTINSPKDTVFEILQVIQPAKLVSSKPFAVGVGWKIWWRLFLTPENHRRFEVPRLFIPMIYMWAICSQDKQCSGKNCQDILPKSCSTMCFTPKDTVWHLAVTWKTSFVRDDQHCYVQT